VVVEKNVGLTERFFDNHYKTLNAAGIKVANDVTGTVRDAVIAYREGKVSADGANVEGSW